MITNTGIFIVVVCLALQTVLLFYMAMLLEQIRTNTDNIPQYQNSLGLYPSIFEDEDTEDL